MKEIATVFFRLGCLAFGGPAAHIAMMEEEIIQKRKWMTHQHFLDLIGITNIIPGPNSTEMTMHCGYERGGWKGLFVAGSLFILPAVIITLILAWLYVSYGQLPEAQPFIYGIKPAVIAIILSAAYKLGKKAIKVPLHWIIGLAVVIGCLLGLNEILAIFLSGGLGLVLYFIRSSNSTKSIAPIPLFAWFSFMTVEHLKIFLIFLKVGAILYGSGYVLFAYLDAELISTGLLTKQELIDAIAVGQMTPGPVLSTATFIGYQLGGIYGSLAATIGIFLPSFLFVGMINPMVHRMRKSPMLSSILDTINVAAVSVIAAVAIEMGKETLIDWRTALIAIISIGLLFGTKKVNSMHIVIGGAVFGYILSLI